MLKNYLNVTIETNHEHSFFFIKPCLSLFIKSKPMLGNYRKEKICLDGLYPSISPFYLSNMKKLNNQIWRESKWKHGKNHGNERT